MNFKINNIILNHLFLINKKRILKVSLLFLLNLIFSKPLLSQTPKIVCFKDSSEYKLMHELLTSKNERIDMDILYYNILESPNNKDAFCELIIYSYFFNYLLQKGLDLNYSIAQNPPMNNSTDLPTDSKLFKKIAYNNSKYKLFSDFLLLKQSYEENVLKKYSRDKKKDLEKDISNIMNNGLYSYPLTLESILKSKYKYLTEEKMNKELIDGLNQNKK